MGISTETLVCEDMTSCTDIAMLSMRLLHSATVLYSNSYYTVVASVFLISTASCKALCRGVVSLHRSELDLAKVTRPSNVCAN